VKTPYGSVPARSACPANNGGYGPHETDAERPIIAANKEEEATLGIYLCKHCAVMFAVTNAK
jgi:hypothetical protein